MDPPFTNLNENVAILILAHYEALVIDGRVHTIIFGDVRTVEINQQFDAIVEWWCLFHIPKEDHGKMIARFASWLKKRGALEFTSGDSEFQMSDSEMLNQELNCYGLHPDAYERLLKENGFKLLLKESDQDQHIVWLAIKEE